MNAPEIVRRYAVTLLEAAAETNVLDAVHRDVTGVLQTLEQSPELAEFLANPLLPAAAHQQALSQLFDGRVQPLTVNFLVLMAQRRRAGLVGRTLQAFLELAEERSGIVRADVVSSVALTDDQSERLRQRLAAYIGKQVRLQTEVDPALGGGLVARIGDIVLDGSVATQLDRLRRRLLGV